MLASSREEIVGVFDALEADLNRALELSFDALTTRERLAILRRCEAFRRQLPTWTTGNPERIRSIIPRNSSMTETTTIRSRQLSELVTNRQMFESADECCRGELWISRQFNRFQTRQ
jgi:hypothetical protein